MSELPKRIERIEIYYNDDREPVDDVSLATWKDVTIFDKNGEMTHQYSVSIVDGVDTEDDDISDDISDEDDDDITNNEE